ncbi:MAG TPA: arylesterase [Caulobacteraceae bacterium]|jgi:acyl-CoA thioesterase-1
MPRRVPFRLPLIARALSSGALISGALIAGLLILGGGGAQAREPDGTLVVTMLGDSLTAGYGLKAADAIPAGLQAALRNAGLKVTVRPAGVSGDTSADGLARVDFSVRPDTDLCLVVLGGNDLLQGVEPKVMKANLDGILKKLKARHIRAMLVGLKAPPAMGADYAREFDAVVPGLAKADQAPAFPDLLGKVALDRSLNQGDGVHPNPEGVKQVVARLAPAVAAALKPSPARAAER